MDRQMEKQRQGRAAIGRVPARSQGRQLGGGDWCLAQGTSFSRLRDHIDQISHSLWFVGFQPFEALAVNILDHNEAARDRANALDQRSVWPILSGLVSLIGARALDRQQRRRLTHG